MHDSALFRKQNNRLGWLIFIVTAIVYCCCIEPTASFWDCGEYIACSYGIETGHPPGAPFFLLIAKAFSLLSFGKKELVAPLINCMSGLASAFTVLFLFWSITHLAKKVLLKTAEDFASAKKWLVFGAGAAGALSYAFTDSFWFSAEEGEVYALSSLFTAIVFWAMLKWEESADDPHSDRWLVFIAYMIGLSIGVHLLNLLTIPALVFIFYFRKTKKVSLWGTLLTFITAVLLLGGIQDVLIPGIVKLAGKTELWFVNSLGFSFNSGTIAFFIVLIVLIAGGLYISRMRRIRWLHTSLLGFAVLLIGYSSFLVIVIRAQAGTPINENNPSNPVSLLSYLNREQYGDWPLLYGQYYNTPQDAEMPYVDGNPVYVKDEKSGKYIVSDSREKSIANYDSRGCTFFPRMYSSSYAGGYESSAGVTGHPVTFTDKKGQPYSVNIPTFAENMRFFITYQCSWMYARYFAWNFIGRQNDRLGYGNDADGNFLFGLSPMDNWRVGQQSLLPDAERNNKARNRYFFLPLLLGVLGIGWLLKHSRRDSLVVLLLFLFTGLAIVFYLNQTPWQPRERDYAYVGSFYAFAIWIGMGVMGAFGLARKLMKPFPALMTAAVLSVLSPVILFAQNLDDHNRSGRTVARDIAIDMLESCEPNAILFTYADNDTFPLWYAQEVLGVRRDVRIICLSLLRSDWYIDQAKRKQYDADPLPVSMDHWDYRDGTRDYMNIFEESDDTLDLHEVVRSMTTKNFDERFVSGYGDTLNYIHSRNVKLAVNKPEFLLHSTLNSFRKDDIQDTIYWRLRGEYLLKDQELVLDIVASNNWKRPIYFATNMPLNCYAGLDNNLQLEGIVLRLVPVTNNREDSSLQQRPQVQLDKSYRLVMNTFLWGGLSDPSVYADETVKRMFSDPLRGACSQIAVALAEAGRSKEACDVINRCTAGIPATQVVPDRYWLEMVNAAYVAQNRSLAEALSRTAFTHFFTNARWHRTLPRIPGDYADMRDGMIALTQMAIQSGNSQLADEYLAKMKTIDVQLPQVEMDGDGAMLEGTDDSAVSDSADSAR